MSNSLYIADSEGRLRHSMCQLHTFGKQVRENSTFTCDSCVSMIKNVTATNKASVENREARVAASSTVGWVYLSPRSCVEQAANSEVEETLKRLAAHKGVEGIVIVNLEGIPIRTTLEPDKTIQYAALITQLAAKARSVVRDLDPQNDLTFLRIRSKKHEIMVAPDKEYILIVLQNPHHS
ncbi:Dynein light chain roadblock-type 2 [Podochytrium sp. JEL0797]|nr:Dynein light chain roadblock-type 2 [Podochytrium sp. JEL0797]